MPKAGYVQTLEHRAKIGAAALGKKHTPEWCANIRFGLKASRKFVHAQRAMRGRHHSAETRAKIGAGSIVHGHARKGQHTPTFNSWLAMISRCTRVSQKSYMNYGARGITVCDRWRESFANFLADMGERPEGKTIDRRDNDKGYSPNNCRWATRQEQNVNRRPRQVLS